MNLSYVCDYAVDCHLDIVLLTNLPVRYSGPFIEVNSARLAIHIVLLVSPINPIFSRGLRDSISYFSVRRSVHRSVRRSVTKFF